MVRARLGGRHEQFLAALIDEYQDTALPVGSQTLARAPGVRISPASIRAILAELEAEGYLFRRHASAGRVPTDLGYRYYVDRLMSRRPPRPAARAAIDVVAGPTRRQPESLAGTLAHMTRHLTLAVSDDRLFVAGMSNIVRQPEFSKSERLAPIFALLEERAALGSMFPRLSDIGEIAVRIGRENAIEAMWACSLIALRLSSCGADAVGVLGPTRMDYAAVVTALRVLEDRLSGKESPRGSDET